MTRIFLVEAFFAVLLALAFFVVFLEVVFAAFLVTLPADFFFGAGFVSKPYRFGGVDIRPLRVEVEFAGGAGVRRPKLGPE